MERSKKRGFKQEPSNNDRPWWKRLWGWTEFGKKSGWEWLQLLVVPLALAVIGLLFAAQQTARQNNIEQQRAESEQKLEKQRAQDAALQAYLDQINLLMLQSNLRNSEVGSEARTLARARTLTVLGRLDSSRKSQVLRFLIEAALVQRVAGREPVVSLSDANLRDIEVPPTFTDLSGADLSGADLSNADLSNAVLNEANLSNANLPNSNLSHSNLSDADLGSADLAHATLSDSDLSNANLRGGDLHEADLIDANLRGAILQQANLTKANLSEANLDSANLAYANLSSADLSNCYLGGVDLSGTDLSQDQRRECSTNAEPQDATIYIEATDGFFDAVAGGVGRVVYGQGSGFIMKEDGTAITTNHVVTGARDLNVYVVGEEDPLPAVVLGVSECFDLALIDIAGGGYPDIEWGSAEIESGLEVTARGYPAEDITAGEQPDQTATKGSINVTKLSVPTRSASVGPKNGHEAVIEHKAPLRLGMSGGPLVTEAGEAVGINLSAGESDQSWAISRDVAKPIIEDLSRGSDGASIGVNGEAYTDPESDPAGIRVASIDSGSPAHEVGVQEIDHSEKTGVMHVDFITKLGERRLTGDETMKTYCDILRTHTADEPLDIQVERWAFDKTGEPIGLVLYEGVLHGEPLQKNEAKTKERLNALSRSGQLPRDCADADENGICDSEQERLNALSDCADVDENGICDSEQTTTGSGYTTLIDSTGAINVEVPTRWNEVFLEPGRMLNVNGIEEGPIIQASPNIQEFRKSYKVPGLYFGVSDSMLQQGFDENAILDLFAKVRYKDCKPVGTRQYYARGDYTGIIMRWTDCGGKESQKALDFAATPEDRSSLVYIQVKTVSEADVEAAVRILNTFTVEVDENRPLPSG